MRYIYRVHWVTYVCILAVSFEIVISLFPSSARAASTSTLTVTTIVTGGTATSSNFLIHVTNNSLEILGSPQVGSATGTTYANIASSTYVVRATNGPNSYQTSFGGDCNASGTIAVASSTSKTCTVTAQLILPTLPFPVGAKVLGLGDSIVAKNNTAGVDYSAYTTNEIVGQLNWARALDPRFNFDNWSVAPLDADPMTWRGFNGANEGVGGYRTTDVLSGIPYALARKPDIIYLQVGTNDINASSSATVITANFDQILTRLRAGGVWVILSTIWPRSTAGSSDPWPADDLRWRTRTTVNNWIKAQVGREGVKVYDPNPLIGYIAPSGQEEYRPNFSMDGVHPSAPAAFAAGQLLDSILATMISPGTTFNTDPTVINTLPGGLLGVGGIARTSNISGAIADNWSAELVDPNALQVPSTAVASKEVIQTGLEKQVFSVTAHTDPSTTTSSTHSLNFYYDPNVDLASAGIRPGDWVQVYANVELTPWQGWVDTWVGATLGDGTGYYSQRATAMNVPWGDTNQQTNGWSGWLMTEPIQISANSIGWMTASGSGGSFFGVDILKTATGTGTIKISRPIIRKVPDPRPRWNF